ncbi:MAG: hypothetical protein P1R58_07160 [bacterium]|nr:hypothetical protein [bacterium]
MFKNISPEELRGMGINPYEAVIIASQYARHLNTQRLRQLERLEEDPTIDLDPRKITMVAIKDLLEGRVKYTRSDSM